MVNVKGSTVLELLRRQTPQARGQRGAGVLRYAFLPADRYVVDFDPAMAAWCQFHTGQDSASFGVWVRPASFETLTYCEGDWYLNTMRDMGELKRELRDLHAFHGS